jgi:hypothetical protein
MSVCCESCVLSGRGLCDELITHPEESYRLWCIVVCDLETSKMRRKNEEALTRVGSQRHRIYIYIYILDRPRPTTLLPPRSNGKPDEVTAVYKLLMMGKRMPETC